MLIMAMNKRDHDKPPINIKTIWNRKKVRESYIDNAGYNYYRIGVLMFTINGLFGLYYLIFVY